MDNRGKVMKHLYKFFLIIAIGGYQNINENPVHKLCWLSQKAYKHGVGSLVT